MDRYGPEFGLPERIYSGHNELFTYGPPDEADTVAIAIGMPLVRLRLRFDQCTPMLELDNGVGVDNEEQGAQVVVCRDPVGGWAAAWPYFEHLS